MVLQSSLVVHAVLPVADRYLHLMKLSAADLVRKTRANMLALTRVVQANGPNKRDSRLTACKETRRFISNAHGLDSIFAEPPNESAI